LHDRSEIGVLARTFHAMVRQARERRIKLQRSEARIRTLLETAAEGILTFDGDGNVESFNRAAERIFGADEAEVRGRPVTELLELPAPPDGREGGRLAAVTPLLGRTGEVT